MTIEGRPEIDHDWNEGYRKQIRNRLADVIGEYVNDDDLSALSFFHDLKDELAGWVDYHQNYADKTTAILHLIDGHKQPEFLAEDRNSNFPNENTVPTRF